METSNVVRIKHVRRSGAAPAPVTPHKYAQVLRSRNTYQRLYEQNTIQLAQARIDVHKLKEQVRALEAERARLQTDGAKALLQEAVNLMTGMSLDRLQFERAMGGVVRLPAKTIEFTERGEALVSRAAPLLLTHGEAVI